MDVTRAGSWVIIIQDVKQDYKLVEDFERGLIYTHVPFDENRLASEQLMEHLGYRLEYSLNEGRRTKFVYTWHPTHSHGFPIKEGYMMLNRLQDANCEVVGVLDERRGSGSLYWFHIEKPNLKPKISSIYYSNVNNGFSHSGDFQGLSSVVNYLNVKERTMIVLSAPYFTGWFEQTLQMVEENSR